MKDKRIDAYIAKSAGFAKPILTHLRQLVHKACPDVLETMKWSFPHFDYHGIMCSMAAFKEHASFGFWKAELMDSYDKTMHTTNDGAMGNFGKLKSLKDLPSDKLLVQYIKEAARLNDEGVKIVRRPSPRVKKVLVVPSDFKDVLVKNKKAGKVFEEFSYSHKKDYIEWITEAKTDATRLARLETSMEWLAEGKPRHWKYMKK